MARDTAVCASFASWMVASFSALSFCRISVAFATFPSSSATCKESSVIKVASFEIEAVNSSISLVRLSTDAVRVVRTCSFSFSSVSHHPLCCASSPACSSSREMRSLIIFLTFAKGSSRARTAIAERTRLPMRAAWSLRYAAILIWFETDFSWEDLNCAREGETCSKAPFGRCLSAAPMTSSLERISIAFSIATISSPRSFCRLSKSLDFCVQVLVRSLKYLLSSALVDVVS
mmetsp:Transcript_83739/g.131874  ORF Transcript_83739/g.131874 Transcript_83739/m.131874 type:complete len:232 (-) Transcript_83739:45-740(-)